jgi:hypothetical protein
MRNQGLIFGKYYNYLNYLQQEDFNDHMYDRIFHLKKGAGIF